jgi:hypothetical protein
VVAVRALLLEVVFAFSGVSAGHGFEVFFESGDDPGGAAYFFVGPFGDALELLRESGIVCDAFPGGEVVEVFLHAPHLGAVVVDEFLGVLDSLPRCSSGVVLSLLELAEAAVSGHVMVFTPWV